MKNYVGIDPGKTGCVAVIMPVPLAQGNLNLGMEKTARDIAYMGGTIAFFDAEKGLDLAQLAQIISRDAFVLIEKAQVMHPKRDGQPAPQGVVSMMTIGVGYGEYLGMLKSHRIPFGEIHPMTWKKEFNLIHQDKQRSIDVAKNLYPTIVDQLTRKKDHGRAEALLLAEYARRRNM